MHRWAKTCVWIGLSLGGVASGNDTLSPKTLAVSDTAESLSSGEFLVRAASTQALWRDRDRWRPLVLEAARSSDPDLAGRAQWVIQRWRRGILPTTPASLVPEIESADSVMAIEILLEASCFEEALVAVEESAGTLDADAIINHASRLLDERFPFYVRQALRRNDLQSLVSFIGATCQNVTQAMCRVDLMRVLGSETKGPEWLPDAAADWDEDQRAAARCLMHLRNGEVELAIAIAAEIETGPSTFDDPAETGQDVSESFSRSLVQVVRLVSGRSKEVAENAIRRATEIRDRSHQLGPIKETNQDRIERLQLVEIRQWIDVLVATRMDAFSVNHVDRPWRRRCRQRAIEALLGLAMVEDGNLDDQDSGDLGQGGMSPTKREAQTLLWRALLMAGRASESIDVLQRLSDRDAASIAIAVSRFEDGFRWLGYPVDQWETELESWLAETVAAQKDYPQSSRRVSRLAPETQNLLLWMTHLLKVGRDDLAHRIVDRLSRKDVTAGVFDVREHVLQRLVAERRDDWAIEVAFQPWQSDPTDQSLRTLSRLFITKDPNIMASLMLNIRLDHPDWDSQRRFKLACAVAMADTDRSDAIHRCLRTLARRLDDGSLAGDGSNSVTRYQVEPPSWRSWVDVFEANARHDLAAPILQRMAASGHPWAMLRLLDTPQVANGVAAQISQLSDIWQTFEEDPVERTRARRSLDASIVVDATIAQIKQARLLGDHPNEERRLFELKLMACSPSTDTREDIAEAFASLGRVDDAQAIYDDLLLMTALASDETKGLTDIASGYLRFVSEQVAPTETLPEVWEAIDTTLTSDDAMSGDRRQHLNPSQFQARQDALHWWSLAFWGTLESVDYDVTAYVTIPMLMAQRRLELASQACLDSKIRSSETMRHRVQQTLQDVGQLQPMSIAIAETILPRLQRRGFAELASHTMEKIVTTGLRHVQRFPQNCMMANNVAWSAAMNGVRYDDATKLARLAVRTEPDSAIYRDTLAECLLRQGEHRQATQIERSCLLDESDLWHLHEQLRRFEAISNAPDIVTEPNSPTQTNTANR
ncbi:MAG: hypothetical protein AAF670_05045 [Planctomycetota bacterium]